MDRTRTSGNDMFRNRNVPPALEKYGKDVLFHDCLTGIAEASVLPRKLGGKFPSDVLGSYTGTGLYDVTPEQDADDL